MTSKELVEPVIKIFELGSIAAGGSGSAEWDSDDDYVIRHILIKADGGATTQSTCTIAIDDKTYTKDKALCNTFGTNAQDALLLNIKLAKNKKFKISVTNNEGAAKTFTVELVLEKA